MPADRAAESMHLKLLLPTRVLVDAEVSKVVAEAEDGSFCLLPRHIDFVAALTPGILIYQPAEAQDLRYVAINRGTLVKCGEEVLVSTYDAMEGRDLPGLREVVAQHYESLDEQERRTRSALARLEAGVLRRFMESEGPTGGRST